MISLSPHSLWSFLQRSGVPVWEYMHDVIAQLLDGPGKGQLYKADGTAVTTADEVDPGEYCFVLDSGQTSVDFARGPEYFCKYQAPNPNGSQSTRSDSKRSTAQQSAFRVSLIARDFACLVTGAPYQECTPCHILYQQLLAIRYPAPMFSPSAGLLLRDDLHHAFDRLELSFYLRDGTYYLHFFILRLAHLHGTPLGPDRFRGKERDRPEPRFIKWHYNQCLKARIRGFSVGMDLHPM